MSKTLPDATTVTASHQPPRPKRALPLSLVWVAVAVLAPSAFVAALPLDAVDLAYHLRAGALMLASHSLVRTDSFTFTAAGLPWFDQQWLSQVLLALAFRAGGWLALAALRSVLVSITLSFVYLACRTRAERRPAAWLTLGSGLIMLAGVTLRPQLFAMALFALTLWLLAHRRRRPGLVWWIVPIVAVWANIHGTFFLVPGLVGLAWLEDLHDRSGTATRTFLLIIATIVAPIVNPFGLRVWTYVAALTSNPAVRGMVVEWQPTSIDSYSGAAFFVSVAFTVVLLIRARTRPSWPIALALVAFFAMALTSVRAVYWWAMAVPVLLSEMMGPSAQPTDDDPANATNMLVVAALALALMLAFARWLPFASPGSVPRGLLTGEPPGVTRAMQSTLRPGDRIFNAQGWGSWFEFELPGNPVIVDSRIELIPAATWREYADVSNGREGWQDVLDNWGVRVVAVSRLQQSALLDRITRSGAWRVTYEDRDGALFVRR